MMDQLLKSELFVACFAYIDDVVIFEHKDLEVILYIKHIL